jgi:hypothetical protein
MSGLLKLALGIQSLQL